MYSVFSFSESRLWSVEEGAKSAFGVIAKRTRQMTEK